MALEMACLHLLFLNILSAWTNVYPRRNEPRIRQTSYIISAHGRFSSITFLHIFIFSCLKNGPGRGGSRVFDIYLCKFWIIWIMTFWYLTVFYHSLQLIRWLFDSYGMFPHLRITTVAEECDISSSFSVLLHSDGFQAMAVLTWIIR